MKNKPQTPPNNSISIREQKQQLRAKMDGLRKLLATSRNISIPSLLSLRNQIWFNQSSVVSLYIAQSFEFPTQQLFEFCRNEKKIVVVPRVEQDQLIFSALDNWPVEANGSNQIIEPHFGKEITPLSIGVFFVPLVAFDRSGRRLGRNGGFYDRLFADQSITGTKIGVGFEFQDTLEVPVEEHDVPMDYILTEKKLIRAL